DRNGVRTPMQWSADRNAGFSRANPQRLILPITIDPEYHYEAVNVEAQQNNPSSRLWWTKRLIALRKQFRAFGRGGIEFLTPSNHRVLAFVRQLDDEVILVVANLSRFAQYVELDLSKWRGLHPVELMGQTEMPPVGDAPYLLTLGGHAFYWLSLEAATAAPEAETAAGYRAPIVAAESEQALLRGGARAALEQALPAFLSTRGWFARRRSGLTATRVEDVVDLPGLHLVVLRAEYVAAEPERFVIPLAIVTEPRAVSPAAIIATLRTPTGDATLIDAAEAGPAARALLQGLVEPRRYSGLVSSIEATPFSPIEPPDTEPLDISANHAAAALRFGDRYLLKMFRNIEEGTSPELEVTRFLNERAPGLVPRLVGAFELRRARAETSTLAVLEAYVPNEGSAWTHAREDLRRFFERVVTRHRETPPPRDTPRHVLEAARAEVPAPVQEIVGAYLDTAALLGRRTADLHLALASDRITPAFQPEPYVPADRRSKYQSLRNLAGRTLRQLRESLPWLPADVAGPASELARHAERVLKRFEPLLTQKMSAMRIRTHGDYHLEQVLSTGKDFVIIDFDGPTGDALPDRRRKHSAFRDVAGMIFSFQYAAASAGLDPTIVRDVDRDAIAPWTTAWHRWVSAAFLRAYLDASPGAVFVPPSDELPLLLEVHLIEQALHALREELELGGETVAIPIAALTDLLAE
ncbi:MAG TPA: alpha-glucosidase C-terminal domain-containing protein, partial [Polyangia bacterium]|nr:alpha-glucosidase C-terminal domain-containing protein [Polyangia bacterium]